MYELLITLGHNPIVRGAFIGALAAANIDFQAFRAWKSFDDWWTYSWSLAVFRWSQGAVLGALTAAGIAGLTS